MDAPGYADVLADAGILGDLRWRVTISPRRQTIGLTAEPGGALTVAIPRDAEATDVVEAVRQRLPWLVRSAGRRAELTANHPTKEIVDGENFPYLGRSRRLTLVDSGDGEGVRLQGDRLFAAPGQPISVSQAIVAWYRLSGATWLEGRADRWARHLGVRPAGTVVDDLKHRWGECTRDGEIALHWATFQLPPRLVDFVVVHELAHLTEPRHGTAFRRVLARALPDHAARAEELAHDGRTVWLGTIAGQNAPASMTARTPLRPGSPRPRLSGNHSS